MLFNEIYQPIFEKNKKMEPFQIKSMSILVRNNEKDKINSFWHTSKTYLTLGEKKFNSSLSRRSSFFNKKGQGG